ncbi:chemotaxis protein CheR [Nibrella viscosa]|uniref:Chemotaxis protein CheR n=1 Tax=Nibrella viscosa TaxID=1084524 RepID=A0ABP8KXQ6_9BACT
MSHQQEISTEDMAEVINLIRLQYGYDFGEYAPASFKRRIIRCMAGAGLKTTYDLKVQLLNNRQFFAWFLETITVNVTEMFRDPAFYKALREAVLPTLASYPVLKIWHAGCATGEEVFSMAILLQEEGLLGRTRIYATDLNPANLEKARTGIVPLAHMREYTQNYLQSGGNNEFASYYTARYENAIINKELRQNILFSPHNLVTDQVFNEFQLIFCRNVLIYFNKSLQNRVIRLFYESLAPLGYLAIGMKESLLFSDIRDRFEVINATAKIFRRKW